MSRGRVESLGAGAVLTGRRSAIRNVRVIGNLDEERLAPDRDCAEDGGGCISNRLRRPVLVAATTATLRKSRSYAIEGALK